MKYHVTHEEVGRAVAHLAAQIATYWVDHKQMNRKPRLFPIPRGGVPVAYVLMGIMDCVITNDVTQADIILDDLLDSGATLARFLIRNPEAMTAVLFDKSNMNLALKPNFIGTTLPNHWLVFPWEHSEEGSAEDIGIRLLQYIGEDPSREGLADTPKRFLKAWDEWTAGYKVDTANLFKDFGDGAENYDEMVMVDPIPFYSHCEHHLAAIFGHVHIGYVPNGRIAGLSKFVRLVQAYARRLQVQERLTVQIADDIVKYLNPISTGVVVRARHFCMESRGAKAPGVETTTTALRGNMKTDPAARAEFISLIKGR